MEIRVDGTTGSIARQPTNFGAQRPNVGISDAWTVEKSTGVVESPNNLGFQVQKARITFGMEPAE
jgi:hypothetical protein